MLELNGSWLMLLFVRFDWSIVLLLFFCFGENSCFGDGDCFLFLVGELGLKKMVNGKTDRFLTVMKLI